MFYPPLLGVWKGMVLVCRKICESINLWHHWRRRVHIACWRRRLLPLETLAMWPLADGWELGCQSSLSSQYSTICLVSESPCLDCANTIYKKYLCSLWESGILVRSRWSVPRWPDPNINVGYWVSNELLWVETRHTCCIFAAGEECALYDTLWEGDSVRKPVYRLFQTLPAHFPLTIQLFILTTLL